MKALCCPCEFFWEGSFGPELTSCLHTSSCHLTHSCCCHGLLGLISNLLVSLYIVSHGYGLVYTIGVCVSGYDRYDAKGLALRLIAILWLCFYINITRVDWGKPQGLCPTCFGCYLLAYEEPLSCPLNSLVVL